MAILLYKKSISDTFKAAQIHRGGDKMLSVKSLETAIMRLHNLRTAQIIAENSAVASIVMEETRDASFLLNELKDLMRSEIILDQTLSLLLDKVFHPDHR